MGHGFVLVRVCLCVCRWHPPAAPHVLNTPTQIHPQIPVHHQLMDETIVAGTGEPFPFSCSFLVFFCFLLAKRSPTTPPRLRPKPWQSGHVASFTWPGSVKLNRNRTEDLDGPVFRQRAITQTTTRMCVRLPGGSWKPREQLERVFAPAQPPEQPPGLLFLCPSLSYCHYVDRSHSVSAAGERICQHTHHTHHPDSGRSLCMCVSVLSFPHLLLLATETIR